MKKHYVKALIRERLINRVLMKDIFPAERCH